jgi:hypothetical protein
VLFHVIFNHIKLLIGSSDSWFGQSYLILILCNFSDIILLSSWFLTHHSHMVPFYQSDLPSLPRMVKWCRTALASLTLPLTSNVTACKFLFSLDDEIQVQTMLDGMLGDKQAFVACHWYSTGKVICRWNLWQGIQAGCKVGGQVCMYIVVRNCHLVD